MKMEEEKRKMVDQRKEEIYFGEKKIQIERVEKIADADEES